MPRRIENLDAIAVAVAPLIKRRAKAWRGREGLKIKRDVLPKIKNKLTSTRFIDYKKGNNFRG